ncbi:MAG TPA: hypothetical protein VKB36_04835, partial [Vicinamibacterales bacterium]|nr:hypothetical protein [Vicinamibacterales bacterium]
MTPLSFERRYQDEWAELEMLLDRAIGRKIGQSSLSFEPVSGARVAALYRRACEHLALARSRSYPAYMVDRLERLTSSAHQLIYRRREFGIDRLKQLACADFPRTVRAHKRYVAVAAATFLLPTVIIGILVYRRPELILSV